RPQAVAGGLRRGLPYPAWHTQRLGAGPQRAGCGGARLSARHRSRAGDRAQGPHRFVASTSLTIIQPAASAAPPIFGPGACTAACRSESGIGTPRVDHYEGWYNSARWRRSVEDGPGQRRRGMLNSVLKQTGTRYCFDTVMLSGLSLLRALAMGS